MKSLIRPMRLAIVLGATMFLTTACGPSSTNPNSPLIQEMNGMKKLILKLRDYAETNSASFSWSKVGTNVDALVEVGVLSPADARYIQLHSLQFRGFDPAHVADNVTVFEMTFTNSGHPVRRIIGHTDGSVAVRGLEASQ